MTKILKAKQKRKNKLDDCNFKQQTLLDFTMTISTNIHFKDVLQKFEDLLKENLKIDKLVLFTHNITWKPILVSGVDIKQYKNIDVEKKFLYKDPEKPFTYINKKTKDLDLVIPVYDNDIPLAFLIVGDNDGQQQKPSPIFKHLKFIQILVHVVVVAIKKNIEYLETIKKEAAFKEMELASKIQNLLIPDLTGVKEKFPDINVDGFYMPDFVVGGDYYDAFYINDEELVFCVADVSGKGISAALLLASFQANLKAIFTSNTNLTDTVELLNEKIFRLALGERFITMFIATYNKNTHKLKYINVAHNPPILYNKKTKRLRYLDKGCIALGVMERIDSIEEEAIQIFDDSKLLCYTDGLVEFIIEGQVYMYDQEIEYYFCTNESSYKSMKTIEEKLELNENNDRIFDDISMLGIDFNIEPQ